MAALDAKKKHVLLVLTSHDKLGETDKQTGWYLPEVAHPYYEFKAAGYDMTFASPKGGAAPCDEGSITASAEDAQCMEFIADGSETKALVDNTVTLASLTDLSPFDAIFFAGGFGTMWDFPDDEDIQRITRTMWETGKVVSAVCHGPCALANVTLSDGSKLVYGKKIAAFTNDEEDAVQCRNVVPWTCEDKFVRLGAKYSKGGVFQPHVAIAGNLITGQNPPSAKPTAEAVITALSKKVVYALCLCRGGSKGIPMKNIRYVAGKPLLCWCMDAAVDSGVFNRVFVSTDSPEIARTALAAGYEFHDRDPATATDGASSESGIEDFLKHHPECDVCCLLQATSPMTSSGDLKSAWDEFSTKSADSLVTVTQAHRFLWKINEAGMGVPQNYRPEKRPLRQQWDGELMENGAFYYFTKSSFEATGSRLSGNVVAYIMPPDTFTEIDEPEDLLMCQQLMKKGQVQEPKVPECTVIAEIGINHNGNMELCKKLIMAAKVSGCKYAKIQKRNPDVCVPEAQKSKMRDTPWGTMTYLEYKWRLEFSEEQIAHLVQFSETVGIEFFASVWDKDSVDLMAKYSKIGKIPSALINDLELCAYAREKFQYLIISTGMSTETMIEECYSACLPDVVMHTNSTYPCPTTELNLNYIQHLKDKFPAAEIGYSGHEYGLVTTFGAVALGATWVERHITWDRTMWGSDQSSSVEIPGLLKLVKGCEAVAEGTMYPPGERILFEAEKVKMESLRPEKK